MSLIPLQQLHSTGTSVSQKKLMFIHYLANLDKPALASEIFHIPRELKLPGLVQEGKELLQFFNLPNIIEENLTFTKQSGKSKVKMAVHSKNEETIKIKLSTYSKLKDGPMMSEIFEEKAYVYGKCKNYLQNQK